MLPGGNQTESFPAINDANGGIGIPVSQRFRTGRGCKFVLQTNVDRLCAQLGTNRRFVLCSMRELRGKPKHTALPDFTFNPDASVHHLNKSCADAESQSRTAIAASRGTVSLTEGLKNQVDLVRRNARPCVSNREFELGGGPVAGHRLHINLDFTRRCELDGIANQVDQDLLQSTGVTCQRFRNIRPHAANDIEIFLECIDTQQVAGVLSDSSDIKRNRFQFHSVGFNLRQVEDVV